MRFNATILFLAAFCLAAQADVIRLKNGKTIVADSVHESNGRIEYTIGDNTFAIPKALVEGIDTQAPRKPEGLPVANLPQVHDEVQAPQELAPTIIHGGQVDAVALKAIEAEGIAEKSAAANFLAASFEEKQNHLAAAERYLQAALIFKPNHAVLLEHYAAVLLGLGRNSEALSYAERAAESDSKSADAYAVLGYAYYQTARNREAIAAWTKSLELRPDPRLQELLARAQRESAAEAEFREQESSHFTLHYEGSQAPDSLRAEILKVLESQYAALQNDLGVSPRNSISVSLYTEEAFFDITRAPQWTAALNDGKIRIPISGLSEMTPSLTRVLRHELTHSFVAEITHGHVPAWLNEGLAQLEEPQSTSLAGRRLAALYASGNQIPLNQLEHSFQSDSADVAAVSYAEALAATECIRARYGMSDVTRLLQRLGEGEGIESALRNTIHSGYAQFETEVAEYLKNTYPQ